MSAVYTSATFTTHYEYRRRSISYPLRNDPLITKLVTRHFEGASSTYVAPTLGTPDAEFSNCYCVGVLNVDHVDGDLMRYDVQYAAIPISFNDFESYPFRFPGLSTAITYGAAKTITSVSVASGFTSATRTASGHGFVAGDLVTETIRWQYNTSSTTYGQTGYANTTLTYQITSVTTNSYTAPIVLPVQNNLNVFISGTVRNQTSVGAPRGAETRIVNSRIQNDFFLPGIAGQVLTPLDIPLSTPIAFRDNTGTAVEVLSSDTDPTQAAYVAGIANGDEFVVECSLGVWMGFIHARRTRMIKYQ